MKTAIKYYPNIIDKKGRKKYEFLTGGARNSLLYWLKRSGFEYKGQRVILNGERIKENRLCRVFLKPGDEVIVTPEVKDPATVGGVVATIATWIGASVEVAASIAAITAFVVAVAEIAAVCYAVYSSFQRARRSNLGLTGDGTDETSSTYTFDGPQTSNTIGNPVPIVYGRHGFGGTVLNQFLTYDGEKTYLNMLISYGQGVINGFSSGKIDDNPIENYDDIETIERLGTSEQTVISGFEDLHHEYNIEGVSLKKDSSHIRTTINDDINAFEIVFNIPGLYSINGSTGGLDTWSITYRIRYKLSTSSTWIDLGETTISGKYQTSIRRRFRKDGLEAGRYDIEITRTSDDANDENIGELQLYMVDEIQDDSLSYPNLALVAIKALATDQISGTRPNVTFVVEGKLVSAPDVRSAGVEVDWEDYYWDPELEKFRLFSDDTILDWDGETFRDQWCANPVWCIKDLLRNEQYGLGDLIEDDNIPDAEYLAMSKVCEEKVADGDDGYEKRYRLDVVLDSQTGAIDLLRQLAAVFDAFIFPGQDAVRIKIDEDEEPVQHFGMGNIIKDGLKQSWKSKREEYNNITIQFADKDKNYALETVSLSDDEALQNGEQFKSTSLRLHTTGLSYALRAGRRALNIAKLIKQSFLIKTSIDAIACAPGDVIALSHDTPQIGIGSGRIASGSTSTAVKLDQEVTLEAGITYKLLVQYNDSDTIEERTVTNSPGTTDTITVDTSFTRAPAAYEKYAIGEEEIHYKKLRILNFSMDSNLDVEIIASEMNSDVYDDTAPVLPETNYSALSRAIPDVEDLALTEMVVKANDGTIINTIEVWFRKPEPESRYHISPYADAKIYLSEDSGASWTHIGDTSGDHYVLKEGIETGKTYTIAVVSRAADGRENSLSASPQDSITIQGKAAPPSDVEDFDVSQQGSKLRFTWTPIPDGDLARYIIKSGSDWTIGTIIAEKIDVTEFEYPIGTIGPASFMIKAEDTSGNESVNPGLDDLTITPPPDMNFALEIDPWSLNREGKLTNLSREKLNLFDPSYARDVFGLMTSSGWKDIESSGKGWDEAAADGDLVEDKTFVSSGSWEMIEPYDLQTIFTFQVTTSLQFQNVSGGSITVQISTSEDGVTYEAFENIDPSKNYRARYVKFKFILETSDTNNNVLWYSGSIFITAAVTLVDYGRDLDVPIGGVSIDFRDDMTTTPRVTSIIVKGGIGIPEVTAIDETGMTVKIWDPVTAAYVGGRTIDWEVKGS